MSLRQLAASDLQAILEDSTGGFGVPITVTSPAGVARSLTGFSTDIGHTIDPQTGVAVAGRRASVALPIGKLTALGLGMPRAVADQAGKPWVVSFVDVGGTTHTYKVAHAMPDRAIGCITCLLEAYKP